MISSTVQLITRSLTRNMILSNGRSAISPCLTVNSVRDIHITSNVAKEFRVGFKKVKAVSRGKDIIMEGENTVEILDQPKRISMFPDSNTPHILFDGVPYCKLPIINIKSTPNNTIMSFSDFKGLVSMLHSAGIEGFKHSKKGTNIAAQQTAFTFANRIIETGVKTIRLRIQGIGPGRMGAIKGLELSKIQIVSITDDTRVTWNPSRPKKQRRI